MVKHISNKNIRGNININKSTLCDITEMIRLHSNYARVYMCIIYYADKHNELITDMYTISKVLDLDTKTVVKAITYLVDNDYIEVDRVKLDNNNDIFDYLDNTSLYDLLKHKCWKYIDKDLVTRYTNKYQYNKITVNRGIIKCSDNVCTNILLDYNNNLMHNKDIESEE